MKKLLLVLLISGISVFAFSQKKLPYYPLNNKEVLAKDSVSDYELELLTGLINFYTPVGGYYRVIPFFMDDLDIYFSGVIKNNGTDTVTNVVLGMRLEEIWGSYVEDFYSDTLYFLPPGETDTLFIDSINTYFDNGYEASFELQYDSIMYDTVGIHYDTLRYDFGDWMWDSYLRSDQPSGMISKNDFSGFSDGEVLIGARYFVPEDVWSTFLMSVYIADSSLYGSTIIGKIYSVDGEEMFTTEEMDIDDYDIGTWQSLICDSYSYSYLPGGSNYYVIVELYGDVYIATDTLIHHNYEVESVIGLRDSDSISWYYTEAVPLVGLLIWPESVEEDSNEKLSIFPNPTSDFLTIQNSKDEVVELIDESGRVVKQIKVTSNEYQVSVSDLPRGIYILRSIDKKFSKKVILE